MLYTCFSCAATDTTGNIFAVITDFSSRDIDISPGPVRAASGTAEDENVSGITVYRSLDIIQSKIGNGDTVRRSPRRTAVLIILSDDDAVIGDSRQRNIFICDTRYGASGIVNCLDTHA